MDDSAQVYLDVRQPNDDLVAVILRKTEPGEFRKNLAVSIRTTRGFPALMVLRTDSEVLPPRVVSPATTDVLLFFDMRCLLHYVT